MATETIAFFDDRRQRAAREAIYETEYLARAIITAANASTDADAILFRGLAARILGLNGALLDAVSDDGVTTDDVLQQIRIEPYKPLSA